MVSMGVVKDIVMVIANKQTELNNAGRQEGTIDAAWQCRADDIVGSLEAGKYADLVILERDPMKVRPADIEKIKVSETWLAGERRYSA